MLTLNVMPHTLGICKLPATAPIPDWAINNNPFFSITKTDDELSIVCLASSIPDGITAERGWRALRVVGQLDFALTGILASIAQPLAENGISIFAISTFDTDYILVKEQLIDRASTVLQQHFIVTS